MLKGEKENIKKDVDLWWIKDGHGFFASLLSRDEVSFPSLLNMGWACDFHQWDTVEVMLIPGLRGLGASGFFLLEASCHIQSATTWDHHTVKKPKLATEGDHEAPDMGETFLDLSAYPICYWMQPREGPQPMTHGAEIQLSPVWIPDPTE